MGYPSDELRFLDNRQTLLVAAYCSIQSEVVLYTGDIDRDVAVAASWCGFAALGLALRPAPLGRITLRPDWREAMRLADWFLERVIDAGPQTAQRQAARAAQTLLSAVVSYAREDFEAAGMLSRDAIAASWQSLSELVRDGGRFADSVIRHARLLSEVLQEEWEPIIAKSQISPPPPDAPEAWLNLAEQRRRSSEFGPELWDRRADLLFRTAVEDPFDFWRLLGRYPGRAFESPALTVAESAAPAPPPSAAAAPPYPSFARRTLAPLLTRIRFVLKKTARMPSLAAPTLDRADGRAEDQPSARSRVVNTGFAKGTRSAAALSPETMLGAGRRYWFWLEVAEPIAESIEYTAEPLPTDYLPPDAVLTVALYSFPNGLRFQHSLDVGEIEVKADGSAHVIKQPTSTSIDEDLSTRRLLFPIRTRLRLGIQQLRCNIYYKQVLLQSRVISARVGLLSRKWTRRALGSELDYTLSRSLKPTRLQAIPEHRLSLMLNRAPSQATHQVRMFGAGVKADYSLTNDALTTQITELRGTLRLVAWGDRGEWNGQINAYRYSTPTLPMLEADIRRLAVAGYRFYSELEDGRIDAADAGDTSATNALETLMRTPGLVQVASLHDLRSSLPAALIYDHPVDTTSAEPLKLCDRFRSAISGGENLEDVECFAGRCPSYQNLTTVCPSGFWGFRHFLGMPLSLGEDTVDSEEDTPTDLGCDSALDIAVAVSTDAQFTMRGAHEETLKSKLKLATWPYAKTRAEAIPLLQQKGHHIFYFYCHGGMSGPVPYILLGPPDPTGITPDNLKAYKVRWEHPRPLVFINGCHTTALAPWAALNFVTSFIERAGAAGVIGTDITVFEPLACEFAQEFFEAFVNDHLGLGVAMRRARLRLLAKMNPLGLVYLPFALASLTLSPQ